MRLVEISGGVASGKTTLSRLQGPSCDVISENFLANPFWQEFYASPKACAFETEITFLLQHYHSINMVSQSGADVITDFSFLLDRAYIDVTLDEGAKNAFLSVYEEVQRRMPEPSLVVHLKCSPEEELRRIRARGRKVEESIELDYLVALNEALDFHVAEFAKSGNVLSIDSEARDFAHDPVIQREVVAEIEAALA